MGENTMTRFHFMPWLVALGLSAVVAGAPPARAGGKEEQAELWFAFREILETRCLKCHDGPGSTSGVNLNDYRNLVKASQEDRDTFEFEFKQKPWQYIKPGSPDKSLLYHAVSTNYMPRGEGKLN